MTDEMMMDVDTPSGGLSPSSSLNFLEGDLKKVAEKMNEKSVAGGWEAILEDENWHRRISDTILMFLTGVLEITTVRNKIIPPLRPNEADEILKGFNAEECAEWKAGVRKGIKTGDWVDLANHRTYVPAF